MLGGLGHAKWCGNSMWNWSAPRALQTRCRHPFRAGERPFEPGDTKGAAEFMKPVSKHGYSPRAPDDDKALVERIADVPASVSTVQGTASE